MRFFQNNDRQTKITLRVCFLWYYHLWDARLNIVLSSSARKCNRGFYYSRTEDTAGCGRTRKLPTRHHLVPKLGIRGALSPVPSPFRVLTGVQLQGLHHVCHADGNGLDSDFDTWASNVAFLSKDSWYPAHVQRTVNSCSRPAQNFNISDSRTVKVLTLN
jgi:hypothetical protein